MGKCKYLQNHCAKYTKKLSGILQRNAKKQKQIKKTKIFVEVYQKNQGKNMVYVVQ